MRAGTWVLIALLLVMCGCCGEQYREAEREQTLYGGAVRQPAQSFISSEQGPDYRTSVAPRCQ